MIERFKIERLTKRVFLALSVEDRAILISELFESDKVINDWVKELNTNRGALSSILKFATEDVRNSYYKRSRVKSHELIKISNLKKYGVECIFQRKEVQEKMKETNLKRYGVVYNLQSKEVRNKIKETCIKRYGGTWPYASEEVRKKREDSFMSKYGVKHNFAADECREKYRKTLKEKYGVENPSQNKEIKEKIKETLNNKYGVDHVALIDGINEKKKVTNLERYGVEYALQRRDVIDKCQRLKRERKLEELEKSLEYYGYKFMDNYEGVNYTGAHENTHRMYKIKCLRCGKVFEDGIDMRPRCPDCFPLTGNARSYLEQIYCDYLDELGVNFKCNVRGIIGMRELDIYCEELGIAFEINGLYWHSCGHMMKGEWVSYEIDEDYHRQKTDDCLDKGIKLFHIWEYEDPEVVKSLIKLIVEGNFQEVSKHNSTAIGEYRFIDRDWCPDPNFAWCLQQGYRLDFVYCYRELFTDCRDVFEEYDEGLYKICNSGIYRFSISK